MSNSALVSSRTNSNSAERTDRDPVYRAAVKELKTLRASIEHSSDKWSLTKGKATNTVNPKAK